MTANSPSSVAESASSTIDPDAQARRGNDGEPSAGFPSDLTIDEVAVDGLLTAEEFVAEFDENRDDGTLYAEYRRLAAEQAALGRVATLVAGGVEPAEVLGAVADEMRRCVPADTAGLWRFESDREITLVAAAAEPDALARWPLGTRTPVDGNTLATLVQRSGWPARIDSYDNVPGQVAARVRAVGVSAAVGVPIIVDGRVWGLAAVGSLQHGPMPADTEVHISRFAELIATAVVAGYRDEQNRQLLAEASRRADLIYALHVARVMLRGPTDSTSSVAVFDGSLLATAAVSAPEAMIKTVGAALDGFAELPDYDRELLFETFRVWQDNDASVGGTAEVLHCHPNTVRHRLRRIEKHTGRSLSPPKDVAELCLTFEVHRRLM